MASVRLKSGSKFYWACVTLPNGKRSQFSTKLTDKAAALEVAHRAERETHRQKTEAQLRSALSRLASDAAGTAIIDPETWFKRWVKNRSAEVSESTREKYSNLADSAGPFFASLGVDCLASLTVDHVIALRNHWAKVHTTGTTNHKLKVLRIALNDAWREHYVVENVAKKVQALKETEEDRNRTKRRDFTVTELGDILRVADKVWRCMSLLGLYTGGQRMGDLARLKRRHIDMERLEINTTAQKTGAAIILPIVPALADALKALPLPVNPEDYLFPTIATASKSSRSIAFGRVLHKAGLTPKPVKHRQATGLPRATKRKTNELGFHSFRHTATTMLKAAGVSEAVSKAIVGHESAAISKNYTHMPMDTMREALGKIIVFPAA